MAPIEPFRGQAVDETMGYVVEDVGERRFHQSRRKKSTKGFYYQRLFREDEAAESPVFKELELTTKEIVK